MILTEKRSKIRELRDQGKVQLSGAEIVRLNNEEADKILVQNGISVVSTFDKVEGEEREATSSPTTPSPSPDKVEVNEAAPIPAKVDEEAPAPAMEQAKALASLLASFTPPPAKVDEEALNALTARVEAMEASKPQELRIIPPSTQESKDLGRVHFLTPDLITVISCGLNAYLAGPAGSFKTSAAEKAAEALSLDFSSVAVSKQTGNVTFLGYMNGLGDYVTTEFRKRYEHGGVFLLDEIDNGNANVLAVLNSALANGSCAFPDGMVKRHEDFRLIATANTFGQGGDAQYVGRCQLDAATLDRFAFISWGYDEGLEASIIGAKFPSPPMAEFKPKELTQEDCQEWFLKVQGLRMSASKLNSRIVISPRATFAGVKLLSAGMKQERVEELLFWAGTSKEERAKIEAGAPKAKA